jgi:hypothetical protein
VICHKNKCIFIHVSKCAGSTIEKSFGINLSKQTDQNLEMLYGWDEKNKLHLQHATPQELIDTGELTWNEWNEYYKFIIVRNPWSRALSDYLWVIKGRTIVDSFSNFLNKKGRFHEILNNKKIKAYRGDHLKKQKEYFFYNNQKLDYNLIIRFEDIDKGLLELKKQLSLGDDFFMPKTNVGQKKYKHYSYFFNHVRKKEVEHKYSEDIQFFNYRFEDKKVLIHLLTSQLPSVLHIPKKHWKKYFKKKIKKTKLYRLVK